MIFWFARPDRGAIMLRIFICLFFLLSGFSTHTVQAGIGTGEVTGCSSSLNIRSGPSVRTATVGSISCQGAARLTILGEEDGWYRIDHNGQEGYVFGRYVDLTRAVDLYEEFTSVINSPSFGNPVADYCVDCTEERDADAAHEEQEEREYCQVEGTDEQWRRNCEQLYAQGIPHGALDYSLRFLQLNATSFRTNQCYYPRQGFRANPAHSAQNNLNRDSFRDNYMSDGISNKCQIVINNTDERIPGNNCQARMYYIDLCQGDSPQVHETYFNLGSGTCRRGRGFTNGINLYTTVLGAFVTNDVAFNFHPVGERNQARYSALREEIRSRHGGPRQATSVGLFGLQNTNNLSMRTGKHMHVSPFNSSGGCPSIAGENWWMINNLAQNGPSLVVNYASEGMEDPEVCTE